jgi:protein SCO1/2
MRSVLLLAWLLGVAPAVAYGAPPNGAAKYFAGVSLVDQDGQNLDLYRDLIEDRTVVIHSFFASCTGSCPVMMNTLKAVQSRLGDRLEHEVRLISISVDPARDTSGALKAHAGRIGARKGWSFLTGSSAQVGNALKRIGQYVGEPEAHMDIVVVGNTRTGLWKKIHGTAASREVVDLIMGVADDRHAQPATPVADVAVRTQEDRPVHFYRDLVRGRIVAVNFIFTGCTSVCTVMGARFAKLQTLLAESATDVSLVSISIDPVNDTPARLSQWSRSLGAKPGWTLVTGSKADIDTLVKSLGASAADPGSHTPLVVIIDGLRGGPWQRLDGLADPATLAQVLRDRVKGAQAR